MSDKPAVSVVIPVYNTEKYLERCLNSLVNQSLKDCEIICINDGSTDKSLEILEEYKVKYPQIVIINQQNKGPSAARNCGIEIAKGEYIGFVDADDWVDLDYFEKLYNSAKANNCDIAVAGIDAIHKWKTKKLVEIKDEIVTSDTDEKYELCKCPRYSYTCNKIYKLQKIKEIGILFEEGIFYEDVIWSVQILYYISSLAAVPKVKYHYFRHAGSIVRQTDVKKEKDFNYAQSKCRNFIKEHNINVQSQEFIKKHKFLGITFLKTIEKDNYIKYIFLYIFHWKKSLS